MQYDQNSVEWLSRIFGRMHHKYVKAEMDRRGLSHASHPSILFALKQQPGCSASQKQLADCVGISAPTAAVSIRRMQHAGILKKVEDQRDHRRNLVTFTEKGFWVVQECQQVFDRTDQAIFEDFSPEEKEQLKLFYIRMIAKLEALGAQAPTPKRRNE